MNQTNKILFGKRLFLGSVFMIIGIIVLKFFAIPSFQKEKNSEAWPSTQGTVVASEVLSLNKSDGKTHYQADVHFKYTVEGKTYSSNNIKLNKSTSTSTKGAKKTVQQYPVDSEVTVYYDPELTSFGILEPGISIFGVIVLCIPASFILVGFLMAIKPLLKILALVIIGSLSIAPRK